MALRRNLLRAVSILAGLILALTALAAGVWLYYHPSLASVQRVTYGQRHGYELSYDVVRPENPNGLGVALMQVALDLGRRAPSLSSVTCRPLTPRGARARSGGEGGQR